MLRTERARRADEGGHRGKGGEIVVALRLGALWEGVLREGRKSVELERFDISAGCVHCLTCEAACLSPVLAIAIFLESDGYMSVLILFLRPEPLVGVFV